MSLCRNDFFTARVSACALFPTAYKYSEDSAEKDKLRKASSQLCIHNFALSIYTRIYIFFHIYIYTYT